MLFTCPAYHYIFINLFIIRFAHYLLNAQNLKEWCAKQRLTLPS